MNSRESFFTMLEGRTPGSLPLMPITMMRAAEFIGLPYGRYALEHKVLAEAQIAISDRFGFDHVSAITETREARDCGAVIRYFDNQPYTVDETQSRLAEKSDLARMTVPQPELAPAMADRLEAIRVLRERVGGRKIVEGWVEGPCTAAADLRGINRLMLDFEDDPAFVRELFDFVVEVGMRFARSQIQAGADVIGVGDPTASLTGPRIYREFIWRWQKRLVLAIHEGGGRVRLHICGNTRAILSGMAELKPDIIDVDSAVPMAEARASAGSDAVLLGGIDPVRVLLHGTPDDVRKAVLECREAAGPRYILGAGCEVPRGTPAINLETLRECAAAWPR
jgi:MtaA/CmuA family methyltransferase